MTHRILSRIQTGALAASAMFLMLSSPASAQDPKDHSSQRPAAKHYVPPAPPPAAKPDVRPAPPPAAKHHVRPAPPPAAKHQGRKGPRKKGHHKGDPKKGHHKRHH